MRAPDLIAGQRYVLSSPHGVVATYMGKHDGRVTLADGSVLYSSAGYLRFSFADNEDVVRVVFLENGAAVKETEEAKLTRERVEREKAERLAEALATAKQFMEGLGFVEAADRYGRQAGGYTIRYPAENVDDIQLEYFSIGDLKKAMERNAQPLHNRTRMAEHS